MNFRVLLESTMPMAVVDEKAVAWLLPYEAVDIGVLELEESCCAVVTLATFVTMTCGGCKEM